MLDRYRSLGQALTLAGSLAMLACGDDVTPSPTTGTLEITTSTSGVEQDADGYTVQVGSGVAQAIGASATLTNEEIDPGTYSAQLAGLAANCTVAGDNPRTFTVTAGETTTLAFTITCTATTGSLSISQSTSGWPADPDGYNLTLDGVDRGPVAVNELVTIEGLPVGEHAVSLSGVAGNCRVLGSNPQTVIVPPGGSLTVSFTVTCNAVAGSLRVSAATSGPAPDADGYTISLDGSDRGVLEADATVTLGGLVPGSHVIGLGGLAGNCQIQGENLRTVTVAPGVSPSIAYSVSCAPPPPASGSLRITTVTTDPDPGVPGYGLVVDGGASLPIGANASSTLANIAVGAHTVQLTGLPDNCAVQGASPAPVTITQGATADLTITVACATTTGNIRVSVASSGEPVDPDGYAASLDVSSGSTPLPANGNVSFATVPAGTHTVTLSGLSTSCHVSGGPSRDVAVTVGATAEVSFVVTCSATTGAIQVTTATGGTSVDPDGYSLSIDGGPAQAIGSSATAAISDLPPGNHTVALAGIAANCTLEGDNPRSVVVTGDATAPVDLAITCSTILGALQITTTTGGSSPDPDGYSLSVDGGAPVAAGSSATVPIEGLLVGAHTVELSGIASNCHVAGDNPRSVDVVAAGTPVTFTVDCLGSDALIAFFSNARDLGAIFVVSPNGTGLRNLTPAGAFEYNPVWSPDGRRLLFAKDADLYSMNAQGTERVKLADGGLGITQQRWSPDGRMIAYVNGRPEGENIIEELWVMRSDGGGKLRLAENATEPSWSPDGRQLAYVKHDLPLIHVRLIGVDGNGDVALTSRSSFQPAWSPNGSRIAFVTLNDKQMFLVNPDGSGEVSVTPPGSEDDAPTWSPDGTRIAFHTGSIDSDIALMNSDGTGRVNLTNRLGFDLSPTWSPDGSRIAYHQSDLSDSEIYIMNADGSAKTNLSKRPTTLESTPAWGGETRQLVASRSVYGRWLKAQGIKISGR